MDFLEKLKEMIMGGGSPQAPPPSDLNEARPWDSPSMRPPMHQMPGGEMMAGPPMASQGDDPFQQALRLEKQKRAIAMGAPEGLWNK